MLGCWILVLYKPIPYYVNGDPEDRVVACYFMSREFAAFRLIFYNGNRNDMLLVASNVSIASDDDQIQAHK